MEGLLDVYNVIKDIRNCSSSKAKQHILTKNSDIELLKKVLIYTYNDNQYGIKKTTLDKMTFETVEPSKWGSNVFKMLDELASSNINKELTKEVERFISYFTDEKVKELIMCILLKDLRFGMNVKSINKCIPNLIPQHQIMLASKFEGKLKGEVSMSLKMDGIRNSVLIENGNIKHISRQGVSVLGLNELNKALKEFKLNGYFVDGELLRKNIDNIPSDDNFRLTTKIVNSKSMDKRGLEFVIFDIVPIEDYYKGESKIPYRERLKLMEELIGQGNEFIRLVPKFGVTNKVEDVYNKLDEVIAQNQEGLMLNTLDGAYGFGKRPKDILKVKKMDTCDIKCLRVEEGEGKYKGKLGKIICDYKGYELGVGSGFTDEEREYYWNNPQKIVGKIIEVQYFEESKNNKGELSLRFPIYKWIREDKDKESYN